MSTNARAIIHRATDLLQDPTSIRWPANELVRWLNDAQLAIAKVRPDLFIKTDTATPVVNSSRQTLDAMTWSTPSVAKLKLVEVLTSASGGAHNAVTRVRRDIMDAGVPTWMSISTSTGYRHYVYDERDPKVFWLYPYPNSGAASVPTIVVSFVAAPTLINDTLAEGATWADVAETEVSVPDTFADDILNIMLFKAYSKDSEFAGNAARAQNYLTLATNSLGEELKAALGVAPKTVGQAAAK